MTIWSMRIKRMENSCINDESEIVRSDLITKTMWLLLLENVYMFLFSHIDLWVSIVKFDSIKTFSCFHYYFVLSIISKHTDVNGIQNTFVIWKICVKRNIVIYARAKIFHAGHVHMFYNLCAKRYNSRTTRTCG